jgi:nucleolar protein 53
MGQPSRKGTKAWRKNVDITDVERSLEELRKEEIQGGKIHQRSSNDLFFVDTTGSEKMRDAIKRKTLVIDDIIKPKSAIQSIVSRKVKPASVKIENGNKTKEISKNIKLKIERAAKKKLAKGIKPGDSLRERDNRLRQKKELIKKAKGGYDIWAEDKTKTVEPYLELVMEKPIRKPESISKKPKSIPNVQITHPGNSYKPSPTDHQKAIQLAADEELKKIEEKEKIEAELSYPPEMDLLPDDEVKFESSDEGSDGNVEEDDDTEKKSKKEVRKKTKADINRQKRVREQLQKEKLLQEEKKKTKQVNRFC